MAPTPHHTRQQTSQTTTLLIIGFIIICLFPNLFNFLWHLPLTLLGYAFSGPNGAAPTTTTPRHRPPPNSHSHSHSTTMTGSWFQKQFTLPARSRGSYLITDEVVGALPELKNYKVGILHLFVQHTSCALSLNENWDDDVRADMSDALDRIAPEAGPKGQELYRHSAEGPDDMPAHIKSALIGASVTIPIKDGRLATGTWQGIWYLEFRASKHQRRLVATIQGEPKA
ncbi:Upf0047 domain protein [Colletotrichum higginsianum IMI 349063]|uniref:Upf0047 domain protein n=4 Tax=Colletotrichum destructivum species complex TaxID=2707350 RepID=A0A1B7YP05_COLHI|nr:Upf0047 domain protein [Colletotrichum higginsianum IMI 349063]OBR13770.1 Upf0047 domain protein [Colletotrichum higginsianum IMI 349063]